MHEIINAILGFVVVYAANLLLPLLCAVFLVGILFRWVIYSPSDASITSPRNLKSGCTSTWPTRAETARRSPRFTS